MGKKGKRRNKNKLSSEILNDECENFDILDQISVKGKSKLSKKFRKKLIREQQNSHRNKSNPVKETSVRSNCQWNKIVINSECPVDRQFLLSSIGAYVDEAFIPLGYHRLGSDTIFYLEGNPDAAAAIGSLDKRIQDPNKDIMRIYVSKSKVPDLVLNLDQLVILKDVLSKRFDVSLSLLDLSNLHLDTTLVENDILVPLANNLIMKQVIKIIKEYAPTTKALNLCKNNLGTESLKLFKDTMDTFQIFALNLEGNNFDNLKIIKIINAFPLTELNLGIVAELKNPVDFVKRFRRELPTLQKLDGISIDSFVEQHQGKFKIVKSSLLCGDSSSSSSVSTFGNVSAMAISEESLKNFLEQYYSITDTPERTNLLPAYTPLAKVELKSGCIGISSWVFNGPNEIGRFLREFPETKHVHSSFNLAFTKIEPQGGIAQVKGHCHINGLPEHKLIDFSRTLTIVPYSSGLCCSSDILEIS